MKKEVRTETKTNKKQRNIIIILSVICLLLIGGMVFVLSMPKSADDSKANTTKNQVIPDDKTPKANATTESNGVNFDVTTKSNNSTTANTTAKNIIFPGFATNTYTFTDKSMTLSLMNPQSNTVNFVYKIYDTSNNKLIYTSGKISPNQDYEWNIQDYFSPGSHKIKIHISTTDITTGSALNGIDENFSFIIQ